MSFPYFFITSLFSSISEPSRTMFMCTSNAFKVPLIEVFPFNSIKTGFPIESFRKSNGLLVVIQIIPFSFLKNLKILFLLFLFQFVLLFLVFQVLQFLLKKLIF